MVELGGVSRPSFYRSDEEDLPKVDRDMDLRDAIQRIALKWPSYGRPSFWTHSSFLLNIFCSAGEGSSGF
jgi:hypothetical protein